MNTLPFIDAHHHLWSLESLYYPWLTDHVIDDFLLGDYEKIRNTYLPEHYFAESRNQNVVMSVHVEAECSRYAQVEETKWLTRMYESYRCPNAIVGHVWLDTSDVDTVLRQHMAYPLFRGVRSKPRTASNVKEVVRGQIGSMDDPIWREGFSLLDRYELTFDLRVPYFHLEQAADLARDFPNVQIVLNHAGLPLDRDNQGLKLWRQGMEALAKNANVFVKISAVGPPRATWSTEHVKTIVLDTIAIFGPERCMFASNMPPDACLGGFDEIITSYRCIVSHFDDHVQKLMFHDNALRIYRPVP